MAAANTWRRVLLLGCTHFPYQDEGVLRVVREFAKDWKPHDTVHLGDLMTVDQVSTYPNDCDTPLKDEFEQASQFLESARVTHLAMGNHEERLMRPGIDRRLRSILDPVTNLRLEKLGVKWIPYRNDRVFHFGKLSALHGIWFNEYAARTHADAYGCCAFVHTHRIQCHQPKTARIANTGFNIGCTCRLDLPYALTRPPTGWAQGFWFGYFQRNGGFSGYQVRLIDKRVVINGKEYSR